MLLVMGKNVIVSEETIRDLLEAHASLSAWYYELWAALRAANATARTPDDAARVAFVERLAHDYPEVAAVARSIRVPRLYVPPPPAVASHPPPAAPLTPRPPMPSSPIFEEPPVDQTGDRETLMEPASVRARDSIRPSSKPLWGTQKPEK